MMTQAVNKKGKDSAGSANIRRQIRTEVNARFLRGLPVFKAESRVPASLTDLLHRLEAAEGASRD